MLAPQSIDPNDKLMVFNYMDVITEQGQGTAAPNNYQKPLSDIGYTSIRVNVRLLDMSTNSSHTKSNVLMQYDSNAMVWYILINDILTNDLGQPVLVVGNKYVGTISQGPGDNNPVNPELRPFSLLEFTVDDRGLEKTLMTQGYEMDFSSTPKIVWRDSNNNITYEALAYRGGSGTNPATSPADVTHRGPVYKV